MPYTEQGVGWQHTDTSLAAARAAGKKAPTLRDRVLATLRAAECPISTEEIARRLGHAFSGVQPRISELRKNGLIEDSGLRGRTDAGKACVLWRAARGKTEV